MHRIRAAGLVFAMLAMTSVVAPPAASSPLTGADPAPKAARLETLIQGNALTSTSTALADAPVRLRDARAGRIVAVTRTDKSGLFAFRQVEPGSYIVELVDQNQHVLAASEILNVNGGETASAIVKLPFRLQPYAGVLGHTVASALLVTATAAATGVLASQVVGEPVSPRR